ncbi:hypothetical protein N9Z13_07250, partial [Luminiphilus sp.]|nr:hypothetical protein [Luminiphilus sp.]
SEPGFRINQRELLQISNHGQQNQRGCLLSTGRLFFLYLDQFDMRGFHDRVVGMGSITLPMLEASIQAWIVEQQAGG